MKHLSEGRKMFLSVMVIFAVYAAIFILFEDYDRKFLRPLPYWQEMIVSEQDTINSDSTLNSAQPFEEASDWHLLLFSVVVMSGLALLLHRYSRRMDERISQEQAEKESRMRRELTQNIAHELKTPVASILGYTDTILDNPDMAEDTRRQFIIRTNAQAQRLTALLQDISTLNRMDYAADVLQLERTDVSQIVLDIAEETALVLAQKNMTLHNCLPQSIIVQGNPSLIYSIFRNLFDNSINYAGEGTTIEISAYKRGNQWHFNFADNGVGFDAIHLPRIFERFYRIDKGRSRQLGGTGLGLAIVKNAVVLHGGSITASIRPKGGLQFDFSLKSH